jgi:hypothetical protein
MGDSGLMPVTDVGTDPASSTMGTRPRFTPKSEPHRQVRDHLIANANFAGRKAGRRKTGSADGNVTSDQLDSLRNLGPGVSLADALRMELRQTTTVDVLSNDCSQVVEADDPFRDMQNWEIFAVLRQVDSRATPSRESYYSTLRQTRYPADGTEEATDLRKIALENSQLNPVDFCPGQSTFLAEVDESKALEDINKGSSSSVIECLTLQIP